MGALVSGHRRAEWCRVVSRWWGNGKVVEW